MTPNRWLAAFAVAVNIGQHTGVVSEPFGEIGTTRVVDWLDLAVPYAVVGIAGIHLAANSIANVGSSSTIHLWDEVVGHYVWYGGLALVVGALALAAGDRPPTRHPFGVLLAVLFGFTVFTNCVEGGTPLLGLATGAVFVAWGLRLRDRLAWLLVPAYRVTVAALVGWGSYWRGWPQFSELGWL